MFSRRIFSLQRAGMRFDYADAFQAARGTGYEVRTEGEFDAALAQVIKAVGHRPERRDVASAA